MKPQAATLILLSLLACGCDSGGGTSQLPVGEVEVVDSCSTSGGSECVEAGDCFPLCCECTSVDGGSAFFEVRICNDNGQCDVLDRCGSHLPEGICLDGERAFPSR